MFTKVKKSLGRINYKSLVFLHVFQPTLIGIALLFGIGNAFDAIVSLVAYAFLLKKNKINILDIE